MKKVKLINQYHGDVELIYGDKTVLVKSGQTIILTEEEFDSIPEHKKYLIGDFLTVIKENKKEEVKLEKNKK